jgi:hypothetical protein
MIKLDRILGFCKKTKPSNIENIGLGFRIKRKNFVFDAYSLSWGDFTQKYQIVVKKKGNPEPIIKFEYIENYQNNKREGNEKIKNCHEVLHEKYLKNINNLS